MANQNEFIKCIRENLIHRFGLPQTITVDQGTPFTSDDVFEFTFEYEFSMLDSTTYYAQANGQAKSTNKILKLYIRKMVYHNPRVWYELLSKVL